LENGTTIVHIDIDPAEIGKNVGTTVPLVGNIAKVIPQLMKLDFHGDWDEWTARLQGLRDEEGLAIQNKPSTDGFIEPNGFVRNLCKRLPPGSVYTADVGQNQIWSAKNFSADGRFLTSGGMGTMGYSVPAAMGAKLACPDKMVVAVCGDGGFQMSMNELATIRQHGVNVKIVVMCNGVLGLVKELQKNLYGGRDSSIDLSGSPDLSLIAAAYGMDYMFAGSDEDADKAVAAMIEADRPVLLACAINPKEVTT
jgi:acetolactate synthase-1/2/3 large subunit